MRFGRLERREPPKPMGEINMTPLIDVMLVLLVIFIIAAPLMGSALKLDLPQAEATAAHDGSAAILISLGPQGELLLGQEAVTPDQLRLRLQDLARSRPEAELQLRADQAVPYGRVAELIGWAQAAGLNRIAFEAQAATAAPATAAPARPLPAPAR